MRNRRSRASQSERLVLALIAVLLVLVASGLGRALGDDLAPATVSARLARGGATEPLYVTLARFLCGESDHHAQDYAALLWTMQRRADEASALASARAGRPVRLSLRSMVLGYSMPLLGHGGARGEWVRALPDVFPTHVYETTWDRATKYAITFLRGELADPCASRTNHFGSPADMAARYPNAVPVDCSTTSEPTVNVYFLE